MKRTLLIIVGIIIIALVALGIYFKNKYGTLNVPPTSEEVATTTASGGFTLPAGFKMEVFADNVEGARTLVFDPRGNLLVAQMGEGKITGMPDANGDGKADANVTVVENLKLPHGMAFRCRNANQPQGCEFYVAEQDSLSIFNYDSETMKATNKKKLFDLPSGSLGTHKTRSLLFLPSPNENKLLISIGSTCNVCNEKDDRNAAILVYDTVSGKVAHYATGLRNSVFMTLHPVTGKVWATEMGRDGLGDDIPPDELNVIEDKGWYGWPWFYGKNVEDMEFSPNARPSFAKEPVASAVNLQAHSAPLGISFIPEEGWPEDQWFNALVAYHGSWNRSVPTGYKIVRVVFDSQGKYVETKDFITGWLTPSGEKIGRPVDILALPGGVAYISDDGAGRVYKLSRTSGEAQVPPAVTSYRATLSGKVLCLPHTDTSDPQTLECAYGIETDNGVYYAVDLSTMSQTAQPLNTGEKIRASGLVTPVEMLSSDHWRKYPIKGIFSITDSLIRL